MNLEQARTVQQNLDQSLLAGQVPQPEVTELFGSEAAFLWSLAKRLQRQGPDDFEITLPAGLDP